jgi:hypothetical protein
MAARMLAAIAVVALAWPAPAGAHIRTGTIAVDYRVAIESVPPQVSARVYPGDRSLRISIATGHTLVVLGYLGEPFIHIGARGAAAVPGAPTAAAAQIRASGRSAVWHDARIRGIRDGRWTIPLVLDGRRTSLSGSIERVSRPPLWPWLALGAPFAIAAVILLRRRRLPELELAALVTGAVVVAGIAVTASGFALDANASEGRWVEAANELVFAAVGGAVIVRGRAQTRVLAAGALGLLGLAVGASKIPVFTHGIVLSVLPDNAVRLSLALMAWASAVALAIGAAVFVEELDDDPYRTDYTNPGVSSSRRRAGL